MSAPWHHDPAEFDRTLEGELPAEDRAAREADLAGDPALAARAEARRRFLEGLAAEGRAWRGGLATAMPVGLEGRVRAALAGADAAEASDAPVPLLRWAVATAAVLLLGVGATFFVGGSDDDAVAMPIAVMHAARAAAAPDPGPQGCDDQAIGSPLRFPPVRDGLRIWACVQRDGGTVAKLYRPEELPSVGYAAMPAPGVDRGADVGRTDLGDTVVFDITYGRKAHYIAVRKSWLERQRSLTPGRESCRACHHLSRVGKENPHRIIERSWKLIGQ